tara:strand:- start:2078 stop:2401 length:324 start_codon:yes stop_codon:yes gene_type:complete
MENQNKKIEEMQILEQKLQNFFHQKQSFQMEFSETQAALKEIKDSKDDVFKVVGQLMIKTDKSKVGEELSNKEKILDLRIKAIEKQENPLMEELGKLREEVMRTMKK